MPLARGLLKATLISLAISLSTAIMPAFGTASEDDIARAQQETAVNMRYLLGHVIEKSDQLQQTWGDFAPYGAALFRGGVVKYVWYAKPGEIPTDPALSIPLIREALKAQAQSGAIVGSAVIYKSKRSANAPLQLNVELEYQTGAAQAFATEYQVDRDNHMIWGDNTQTAFAPKVFIAAEKQ